MIARWWPPIGFAGMALLGWAVRTGPLPVDSWFQRLGGNLSPHVTHFLGIIVPVVLTGALLVAAVVAARRGRKRLAVAMVVSPLVAVAIVRLVKPIFGREKGGALAYPSGHTTFLVVAAGLLLLVAGAGLWAMVAAAGVVLLSMVGLAMTFHYFTDTVGGVLLGTSVVGVVALWACDGRSGEVGSPAADLR
ncbi:PA-phosphatase [Mycolicibacterium sp. HK-90]|uniref:PA-phosphatase n=1 Tax=Mycolicibacterium sp. HK-90 TaxID=3056937 RepID=UPI00265B4FB2|nr:PA-phosphatase [Mycolicibacterium sp. HK-90]WKG04418.1 PA-phosphatase [Mycolicibacterium sp. HK-90]